MRFVTSFILLVAFTGQTFRDQLIMLGYYANRTAFAKNCENKAKPKLHCNGKCQAMKKVKEEENKDGHNPIRKAGNGNDVLSSKSFFPSISKQIPFIASKKLNPYCLGKAIDHSPDFFHPPQV